MHLKRWLTAIIAVPILIVLIGPGSIRLFGPGTRWLFYALVCAAALAGLMEYYGIASPRLPKCVLWLTGFLTVILFAAICLHEIMLVPVIILLWAFVPTTWFMLTNPRREASEELGKTLFGPVYAALPLALLILIHMRPNSGPTWIFFLLVVVFAGDTGAFYAGRLMGRHKLYEAVSPNKTWEGAVGGLIASLIFGSLFIRLIGPCALSLKALILVVILSVSAQVGDLCESMLKRYHGVKDSGFILPGHGGILDRIDGLLFAIPVLYVYLSLDLG